MIYLHNHSKLWAFLSNGFNSRFWGVLLLWLLGKCKRLTVTQKEAQKENSQNLQRTPSIECCIHTPTEFGVGFLGFFGNMKPQVQKQKPGATKDRITIKHIMVAMASS